MVNNMVKRITLKNGTRLILERMPMLDTVSIGFVFLTGSANETKEENGYTHFIEHMLFKGTHDLTAKDIIRYIEGVGGIFNAFTSRHLTTFYINIISKYFDRAIDTLENVIMNSAFREDDIEKEKKVIIEELKMSNDTPEEITANQFFAAAYKGTSMSFPIGGNISNIKNWCVIEYNGEKIVNIFGERDNYSSNLKNGNYNIKVDDKLVLITAHRRENHGERIDRIIEAIKHLAEKYNEHTFVIPVHPNPNVKNKIHERLGKFANIKLLEPLDYPYLVYLMKNAKLILTDSGGIQEEAPSFGCPTFVMRYETERQEGIDAGVSVLVGADYDKITSLSEKILSDTKENTRLKASNPYGDGTSAKKITSIIKEYFKPADRIIG